MVFADELGYIAAARYFAPDYPDIQMLSAFYHFGYGLLLAPLAVVFDEPGAFYRAATLFNSFLAVGSTIVFHRLILLRYLDLAPALAAVAASAFALTPSLLVNTSMVWAETALVAIVTGLLVLLLRLFERQRPIDAIAVGALGAFAYGTHPRAIVLTAAVAGVVIVGAALRHLRPRIGGLALVSTIVGLVAVRAMNAAIADALYTEGSILESAGFITGLISESPPQWLAGLGGTAWYQLLATAGVGLFGLWWLVRHLPTWSRREMGPPEVIALFVASSLGVSWLVGAVISIGEDLRIDQLYYGRYLDIFAPFLIGFGVVGLSNRTQAGWRVAVAAVVGLLAGGWLISLRGSDNYFAEASSVQVNVPVINAMEQLGGSWDPTLVAMFGALAAAVVLVLFLWRDEAGVVAIAVFFLLMAEVTVSQTVRPASLASEERAALAGPVEEHAVGGTVFLAAPYEFWTLNNLQFWADDVQFQLESHCPTAAFDVVVAPTDDDRYIDWAVMAADPEHDRQVLIDLSETNALSRSIRLDVLEATSADGLMTATVEIENLDDGRLLRVGDTLSLYARWLSGSEPDEVTEVRLVTPLEIAAGSNGTHMLEFSAPASERATTSTLSFDVRDEGRGWLSESPCAQSSFGSLNVDVD